MTVLTSVCFVPATPLLAPQLGGTAAGELAQLRGTAVAAVQEMARRADAWVVLGAGEAGDGRPQDAVEEYPAEPPSGTFAGFGVDLRVELAGTGGQAPAAAPQSSAAPPSVSMGLPLLIAGWLRAAVPADLRPVRAVRGLRVGCDAPPELCAREGGLLRARIDGGAETTGVLVVADGPDTLTLKAPGAFDPDAEPLAREVARAIAEGDTAALRRLDPTACARTGLDARGPLQTAAALVGDGPVRVRNAGVQWPYGVAYYTGLWEL